MSERICSNNQSLEMIAGFTEERDWYYSKQLNTAFFSNLTKDRNTTVTMVPVHIKDGYSLRMRRRCEKTKKGALHPSAPSDLRMGFVTMTTIS